jgi:hypothetical protein
VYLFRRTDDKVDVIHEWIRIGESNVQRFADYIFARFDTATVIALHAVKPDSTSWLTSIAAITALKMRGSLCRQWRNNIRGPGQVYVQELAPVFQEDNARFSFFRLSYL